MNQLKKTLGLVWMLIAPALLFTLFIGAGIYVDPNGKAEINQPVPWIIIIAIFAPIAIGFFLFGWYAWKGEYDKLPENSEEI